MFYSLFGKDFIVFHILFMDGIGIFIVPFLQLLSNLLISGRNFKTVFSSNIEKS